MLILCLIVSGLVLLFVNAMAQTSRSGPAHFILLVFAGLLVVGALYVVAIPVILQSAALGVLLAISDVPTKHRTQFFVKSFGLTVACYLIVLAFVVYPDWKEFRALQAEFPVESMEDRIPQPQFTAATHPLKNEVEHRFSVLQEANPGCGGLRTRVLDRLHNETVSLFVNSPGFGAFRMLRPSRSFLSEKDWQQEPIPQPGQRETPTSASEESGLLTMKTDDMTEFHYHSINRFVFDESRFGLVKSRRAVAGFLPHQFQWAPESPKHYQLQTLDLIGLVVHPQPIAYVSDNLPRMEELRKAPTRELNEFESAGLDEIKKGDDLFAREGDAKLRLFGAIRATKQCTECHGCQRGDLLGAFSYALKRSTP